MAVHAVKVWDWPVRVCHWSFALLVPVMWWTAENSEMAWHMRIGQLLLAIVVFRIAWGFLGSSTARFAGFLHGPATVMGYVMRRSPPGVSPIGHNPLGGWSVVALLLLLLIQTSTGLFAGDPFDGATGPLNATVGVFTADWLTEQHETLFWVLVGMIGLHLTAIVLYQGIGLQNLVEPMISGKKHESDPEEGMVPAPMSRLFISLGITAIVVLPIAGGIWSDLLGS